eukprot:114883_1
MATHEYQEEGVAEPLIQPSAPVIVQPSAQNNVPIVVVPQQQPQQNYGSQEAYPAQQYAAKQRQPQQPYQAQPQVVPIPTQQYAQQPQVIVVQPNPGAVPLPTQIVSRHSQQMLCSRCGIVVPTVVSHSAGLATWAVAGGLCLFGCWLGCCLIPFCVDDLQDVEH